MESVKSSNRSVRTFMERHNDGATDVGVLEPVIDLALSNDVDAAGAGTAMLFGGVIESLADTFAADDRKALERVLARVIARVRSLPQASALDERLSRWGLVDESACLRRVDRMSTTGDLLSVEPPVVSTVFVLSRVTLGADILLNTPVLQRAALTFPKAQIVFIGDPETGRLLVGDIERAQVVDARYGRREVLARRILNWLSLVDVVEERTSDLSPGKEYLVIDLDSRLLQSGLLPVMSPTNEENHYLFWRGTVSPGSWRGASQGEDVIQWLDGRFGPDDGGRSVCARISLSTADDAFAETCRRAWGLDTLSSVVSMNLGVGGNEAKRVGDRSSRASLFERELIRRLLSAGTTVIVDRGAGDTELRRAAELTKVARDDGFEVIEATEERVPAAGGKRFDGRARAGRLLMFQGSIAKFAALVTLSSVYIGYDSLGQHLAGALGKDIVAVFAGYPSPVFVARWRPMTAGVLRIVEAGTGPFSPDQQRRLVEEVLSHYESLRPERGIGVPPGGDELASR